MEGAGGVRRLKEGKRQGLEDGGHPPEAKVTGHFLGWLLGRDVLAICEDNVYPYQEYAKSPPGQLRAVF